MIEVLKEAMNVKGYMLSKCEPSVDWVARKQSNMLPVAGIKLVETRPQGPESLYEGLTPIHYLHAPSYAKGVLKWL